MKLLEFAVTGYKNLSREVRLTDLGRINVIHGDNNVGKSNVLEALQLFFALLGRDVENGLPLGPNKVAWMMERRLLELTEHRIGEIFDMRGPLAATIRLEAKFSVSEAAFNRAGILPVLPTDRVTIVLELAREYGRPDLRISVSRFQFNDVRDAAIEEFTAAEAGFAQRLALLLARNQLMHDPVGRPAFALIEENRRVRGRRERLGEGSASAILSPTMLLNLWDASVSADPSQIGRWKLLKDLAKKHLPPFQSGDLLVTFDRSQDSAFVVHEGAGDIRLRHHLLGTGVQQVLSLLGLLLTTDARWVAIEEPECNLRYTLQLRLREALDTLTRDERGPGQLFVTSHSPAFETEAYFYAMRLDAEGVPVIERRPKRDARMFVAFDAEVPPAEGRGEVSWVSSEGLVLVPPRLRPRLEVQNGGEVAFLTNHSSGRVEILSEREFLDVLGPAEEDA